MKKIKHFIESDKGKDLLVILIIILVGLASFELGRLSNTSSGLKIASEGQIEANPYQNNLNNGAVANIASDTNISQTNSEIKRFFASKKGKKYYSTDCSAGKTIKEENKVYFDTGEEAEKAGYELSSACQ